MYFRLIQLNKIVLSKKFKNFHNNIKKTWQYINSLLGRTSLNSATSSFFINGKKTCDSLLIANEFNDCFSNIAINLVNQLPKPSIPFHEYLAPANPSSIFFYPISPYEVKQSINKTSPKHSSCWDGIPLVVLKYLPDNIINALTYTFNLSLCQGKFVTACRHAKVVPIHKKGDVQNLNNCRPISLLSSFSKIFEKNRLQEAVLIL